MLERLKSARGQFIALAELGDDHAQVWHDLEALEQFGFQIDHHPYLGASYVGPSSRICPDQIEHNLETRRIGRRIAVWNRVGSTNDLAAQAGANPANDGLVVLAEEQTSGRGQRGRHWMAPPRSSILMSVLVFPPPQMALSGREAIGGCAWLTVLGALAVAELVTDWAGVDARIKWPNDVRVDGRKIAGVLVERALAPLAPAQQDGEGHPRSRGVVIGIGLNVDIDLATFPPDLRGRVTSLRQIGDGREIDRSELVRKMIMLLDILYDHVITIGSGYLSRSWRARSEHLGTMVQVVTRDGRLGGRLVDLDLERGLTLELGVSGPSAGETKQVPLESVLSLEEWRPLTDLHQE
jgi:BirA family transcriptional regulator, biotin operon repressor / biotin---[acetyl-CoA-carboxylase] ligase